MYAALSLPRYSVGVEPSCPLVGSEETTALSSTWTCQKVEFNVYYSEHLNDHLNGNVTKKQRKSESRYMRQLLSSILLVHHDSICIKKFEV